EVLPKTRKNGQCRTSSKSATLLAAGQTGAQAAARAADAATDTVKSTALWGLQAVRAATNVF
ncbi:MAG TPA: hypothetical protein VFH90_03925, partial [Candidatus Limnocylindria bacterium]|nr:hypothetical protein [Candidatus Limnocylindria bacterium]